MLKTNYFVHIHQPRKRGVNFFKYRPLEMFSRQPWRSELPLKDRASLVAQSVKDPPAETSVSKADPGSVPGLGRSPGEGNGN